MTHDRIDPPPLPVGHCSRCANGEHGLILDDGRCLCCSAKVRERSDG